MANGGNGLWGNLFSWPLIGIHSVVTQDGKVLTFGTDKNGVQGSTMYHDLWDPVTGQHETIDHHTHTPTDIFCSAAIIVPGTSKVLIAGGDARPLGSTNNGVNDTNLFDYQTHQIASAPEGEMRYERWYPTTVSLSSGQVVVLGGTDVNGRGQGTPEIYTPGEGWRALSGAADADLAATSTYPRSFVDASGKIVYFGNGTGNNGAFDVMRLDPAGNGSLAKIGTLPFTAAWDSPVVMFKPGKLLVSAANNDLWVVDINGAQPTFTKTTALSQERNWSNMTVLADGKVLINGGTSIGNAEAGADKRAAIWNPDTGTITYGTSEAQPRLYHSTSVLLPDGSVLSLGGGAAGSAEHNFLDGQIYKPGYLFDANGAASTRPVVSGVPKELVPGKTFTMNVDNANAITKLTFVKNGAATHAFNMETRIVELAFKVTSATALEVTLPANPNEVSAGSWMLFAWNAAGTPALASVVSVLPTIPFHDAGGGNAITGTAGDDAIEGTDGKDIFAGLGGNDVFHGGKGNDIFDGGTGSYNQVDYDGAAADYTFSRNVDGSIRVAHATYGIDTLRNINGLWFGDEGKWYSPDELAGKTGSGGGGGSTGQTFTGTAGDDAIEGTAGNDTFLGLGGNDVFHGGKGNDTFDGGTGTYNQVDYDGRAADYTFTRNADGTIKAVHALYGTDTLKNINGLWFGDEGKWYAPDELVGGGGSTGQTFTGTAGNDAIDGTDGNDTFNGLAGDDTFYGGKGNDSFKGGDGYDQVDYAGKAADYTVVKNANGSVTISHAEFGQDILESIEGLYFYGDGAWHAPDELVS